MGRFRDAARKQTLLRLKFRLLNPGGDGSSRRLGQFKLHGPLGLFLHDHRSRQNLIAVGDVAHTQIDEIATTQLAVKREVKHCQVSDLMRVQKLNPDGQMSFGFSGGF
jgi:hypothetical protein